MVHKHRSMGMWRSCSSREIFRWQRETYNNNNIYFLKISCPYFSTAYYLWILNFNIRSYFFLARPYIFVVKGCWLELEIIYSQLTFFILNFWFSLLCAVQSDTREQQLRFVQSSPLNSYSSNEVQSFVIIMFIIVRAKNRTYISWLSLMTHIFVHLSQDLVMMPKRRGGKDKDFISHSEWLNTVQTEPDVISMSFIPITSLLNGVPGSGFLNHAINLYLRRKWHITLFQYAVFQSCT